MDRELASNRIEQTSPLVEVRGLTVEFPGDDGPVAAVDGIDFDLTAGRTLGMVGESGCGKTMAALALLRLPPPPGRISAGSVRLNGENLLEASNDRMRSIRGNRIAMIFQEPMTALNPVFSIGDQVAEALTSHRAMAYSDAWEQAVALLDQVGIPAASTRAHDYPHSMSGGQRQRVMIAMALACRPALLIADEPTTALDVTVQAQILELLLDLQNQIGMAILFISHDLGVISEVADHIAVMYAGRIVENAPAENIFQNPQHPYTRALLDTIPRLSQRRRRLPTISGSVPLPGSYDRGCRYANRCPLVEPRCRETEPALESVAPNHWAACLVAQK